MATDKTRKNTAQGSKSLSASAKPAPKSLNLAQRGVTTANDFAGLMSALMADLISGTVSAEVGNATCKAGSNLLKVVEMQHKYGQLPSSPNKKVLTLVSSAGAA